MSFLSVTRVEFTKLLRKRISLLLLLFFVPAVLLGIGMLLGLSFFVSDGGGVDAVGKSLSGIGVAVTIMEQSKYIIFLVIIILAAFILSGELENGQIKSEIYEMFISKQNLRMDYCSMDWHRRRLDTLHLLYWV
ncbi:hypothetical protein AALB53_20840 [Lachnospiraceae bacterium 47-T17]